MVGRNSDTPNQSSVMILCVCLTVAATIITALFLPPEHIRRIVEINETTQTWDQFMQLSFFDFVLIGMPTYYFVLILTIAYVISRKK